MAKIDELLKELCPDGVELVKFTDYANVQYGFAFDAKKFTEDPVYLPLIRIRDIVSGTASTYYSGKYSPEYIVEPGDILVGMDGNFNLGVWKDSAGLLNQRVCKLFSKDESILLNGFIKYYMKPIFNKIEQQTSAGSVKHLSAKTINGIKIHLPPLPIQQHIVEVLDTFNDAISNLEEELALREKQFEYYREQLLAFDDESSLGGKLFSGKVEWKELQDVSSIVRGASPRPIKNFLSDKSEGIPWIKIGDADPNDKYIVSTAEFINKQGASKSRFLKKGSFILSNSMSFGRPYILTIDGCIHDGWIAISDYERQINADYLYYVLKTANVKKYWSMSANNGAVSNLNADIVRGTVIPIPSLCAQQDIVEILNTFEAMIANIKEEIALRTKQYEYYREKLLSFGK